MSVADERKIPCEYMTDGCKYCWFRDYTCIIRSQKGPLNLKITPLDVKVRDGLMDIDITAIKFLDSRFLRVPQGINDYFKRIKCLTLSHCGLTEINKSDLQDLKRLVYLDVRDNSIEVISGDLFACNPDLRGVCFAKNKLIFVGEELFKNFTTVNEADFRGNPGINLWHSTPVPTPAVFEAFKKTFKHFCEQLNLRYPLEKKIGKLESENESLKVEHQNQIAVLENKNENLQNQVVNLKEKLENEVEKRKNAQNDIENLLKDERFTDFTFTIDGEEFKVHKFIFMAKSQLFREMIFETPNAESLKLTEVSTHLFKQILSYVYFDTLPRDDSNFLKLFVAASKLEIEKLRDFIAQKLIEKLNAENCYECLLLCQMYHHQELKLKVYEEIKKDFPQLNIELDDNIEKVVKLMKVKKEFDNVQNTF